MCSNAVGAWAEGRRGHTGDGQSYMNRLCQSLRIAKVIGTRAEESGGGITEGPSRGHGGERCHMKGIKHLQRNGSWTDHERSRIMKRRTLMQSECGEDEDSSNQCGSKHSVADGGTCSLVLLLLLLSCLALRLELQLGACRESTKGEKEHRVKPNLNACQDIAATAKRRAGGAGPASRPAPFEHPPATHPGQQSPQLP